MDIIEPWIWKSRDSGGYYRRARWVYNFHAIRWETDRIPHENRSEEATALLNRWFVTDASPDDVYDFVEALPEIILADMNVVDGDVEELEKCSRG